MTHPEERRKWPRQDMVLRIRLRPLVADEGSEERQFYTRNISTGGLYFEGESPQAVLEGAVFHVEINMPLARFGFASSRRLEASGRICRIDDLTDADRVGVALEFMAPPRFVSP